jgi:hypothetical protein
VAMRLAVLLTVVFGGAAFGAAGEGRAKLIGTWRVQGDSAGADSVWSLQEKGGAIRITHSLGDQKVAEIECNTMGKECSVRDAGRQAKISMWYNGPKLVELEIRGSEVIKRRFALAGDDDSMEIELIPISPAAKTETIRLKRADASTARR